MYFVVLSEIFSWFGKDLLNIFGILLPQKDIPWKTLPSRKRRISRSWEEREVSSDCSQREGLLAPSPDGQGCPEVLAHTEGSVTSSQSSSGSARSGSRERPSAQSPEIFPQDVSHYIPHYRGLITAAGGHWGLLSGATSPKPPVQRGGSWGHQGPVGITGTL